MKKKKKKKKRKRGPHNTLSGVTHTKPLFFFLLHPPRTLSITLLSLIHLISCVTPSKDIGHARLIGLYLDVATGIIKDFKMRKYSTTYMALKFHNLLSHKELQFQKYLLHKNKESQFKET